MPCYSTPYVPQSARTRLTKPMARIRFCCWLRHWSRGRDGIEVEALTLRVALLELARRVPTLPAGFIDEDGSLNPFWMATARGDHPGVLASDSPLGSASEVLLVPKPIAASKRRILDRDVRRCRDAGR